MRISNNFSAQNNNRQQRINNNSISKNFEKLSSGRGINRSGDNAAGFAISEKMRTQILGMNMASRNSQDTVSLIQTAEGALQGAQDILQRMRELAVQSSSDTNTPEDRQKLQTEVGSLVGEIDDIADKTEFNNITLIDGSFNGSDGEEFAAQTGANAGDELKIELGELSAESLGVDSVNISQRQGSSDAIGAIDSALSRISAQRAELGAMQNRMEFKIQNLSVSAENLTAADSRIRDTDMAKMMTELTKNNILSKTSTAMQAQANAQPQGVLQLLG